ncbi:MAG: hypothetical protein M3Q72_14370, partial [Actinomycetota bacterium]|nr:hypothetical protein [Actinomycetota bacterium]
AAVAVAATETARRWRPWPLGTGALLVAVAGVYVCVPETDHLRAVAVAVALLVIAEASIADAAAVWPVVTAAAALVAWSGAFGGVFRESSLVAALSMPGVLLVEPLAVRLGFTRRRQPPAVAPALLLAGQAVFVLVVGRVAGLREQASLALLIVVVSFVALTVGVHLVTGRRI